ncbi:hypothetical protein [Pedobacter punctiformis]|uniref:Uncharacterized protein n=1 Tax=Pedobacter punctiformis TaxID=3004097 RepID=A0ABT4L6K4_9SPHI|nr:hypothetical protein [Pedobacter sp. HCMS5-2]MCZ4243317.1 hypothetical protein [Pedobacter sp. HCMS5-2]
MKKKQKVIRLLKVLPILGLGFVMYLNISATTIKKGNALSLAAVRSALSDTNCEQECFSDMDYDQNRTWDRARDNMWGCVDGSFYDALAGYILPDSGNPALDFMNAVDTIAETFPTIWDAYGCLDFMETQMNLELDQVYDNYTDCVLFGCN